MCVEKGIHLPGPFDRVGDGVEEAKEVEGISDDFSDTPGKGHQQQPWTVGHLSCVCV